jgi:hypothetical protein
VRALPAYARSYRSTRAWTNEGAVPCSLAQQAFGVICVVTPGSTGNEAATVTFDVGRRESEHCIAGIRPSLISP